MQCATRAVASNDSAAPDTRPSDCSKEDLQSALASTASAATAMHGPSEIRCRPVAWQRWVKDAKYELIVATPQFAAAPAVMAHEIRAQQTRDLPSHSKQYRALTARSTASRSCGASAGAALPLQLPLSYGYMCAARPSNA